MCKAGGLLRLGSALCVAVSVVPGGDTARQATADVEALQPVPLAGVERDRQLVRLPPGLQAHRLHVHLAAPAGLLGAQLDVEQAADEVDQGADETPPQQVVFVTRVPPEGHVLLPLGPQAHLVRAQVAEPAGLLLVARRDHLSFSLCLFDAHRRLIPTLADLPPQAGDLLFAQQPPDFGPAPLATCRQLGLALRGDILAFRNPGGQFGVASVGLGIVLRHRHRRREDIGPTKRIAQSLCLRVPELLHLLARFQALGDPRLAACGREAVLVETLHRLHAEAVDQRGARQGTLNVLFRHPSQPPLDHALEKPDFVVLSH
ncbi:hypothetical protein [Reticulibacter mediterranei]|uniref:hypothetical protein n=1 Tax=Reticulibacter mediterranei TaxID=2778369 RepID=UPI001C68EAE4|nr:hypothetical protein [Reticulibacter mediterranei]